MKNANRFIVTNNNQIDHKLLNHLNLDLYLAALQRDAVKVKQLLAKGANANFQVPAKLLNKKELEKTLENGGKMEALGISKENYQIINIKMSVANQSYNMRLSNEETESILSDITKDRDVSKDVVIALVEAGANIKQTEYFDILKAAVEHNNIEFVYYLTGKGLDPYFKDSENLFSAFEYALALGNLEIFNHFITKNFDVNNIKYTQIPRFAIDDRNFQCLELLLKMGFQPSESSMMIDIACYVLQDTSSDMASLQKIIKYGLFKEIHRISVLWDDFIENKNTNGIKILLENNAVPDDIIYNFSQSFPDASKVDPLGKYIYTHELTDGITTGRVLNDIHKTAFYNLLYNDKDCAEIFLGRIKSDILNNGYYQFKEDLTSLFANVTNRGQSNIDKLANYLVLQYSDVIPQKVINQLTNGNDGIFDILERKYLENLHNLEQVIIIHNENLLPVDYKTLLANPKFVKITELMRKQGFEADILTYLNSDNFKSVNEVLVNKANEELKISKEEKNLIDFYHQNIIGKEELHYLTSFFNNEYVVNYLAHLIKLFPDLVPICRSIITTKNLHPDNINDKIELALDLYYTVPNFEDNAELSGDSNSTSFEEI